MWVSGDKRNLNKWPIGCGLETESDLRSPALIIKEKLICLGKFPKDQVEKYSLTAPRLFGAGFVLREELFSSIICANGLSRCTGE